MQWSTAAPSTLSAIACLTVIGLLVLPNPITSTLQSGGPGLTQVNLAAPQVRTTLSLGTSVGVHLNSPFYSVVVGDGGLTPQRLTALGLFLNSTPIGFLRVGDGGPSYDPTTSTVYSPPPRGGTYVGSPSIAVNLDWFKAWCNSRTPHCAWIVDLPGQVNDTAAAVHWAKWYHNVLGFAPTMWELGNEPNAWTHYGKNVTHWSTSDNLVPTPMDYATMAKNYIKAVQSVFPSDRFVAIESSCACSWTFLKATASVVGTRAATFAYHDYPNAANSTTNLTQFYAALQGPGNIPNSTAQLLSTVTSSCPTCANLPVELGEYQAGPPGVIAAYSMQYSGAAFMAASVIQALESNASTLTVFDINWLYSSLTSAVQPQGLLYQRILANMTMGTDYAVKVNSGGVGGVYAVEVRNGSRVALLLVNTNMTYALSLTLGLNLFPVAGLGSMFTWSPSSALPFFHRAFTLPTGYLVPRQGILLLTNY